MRRFIPTLVLSAVLLFAACDTPTSSIDEKSPATSSALADAGVSNRAGHDEPGMHRQYGTPVKVGNGMARAYVVLDAKHGQSPVELGIALDAKVLDHLPTSGGEYSFVLSLPRHSPAPYQFAELDWNPQGHEPEGVYTFPHFDFHFYTISLAERNAITPSDPQFAAKANNLPTGDYVPPYYTVLAPPGGEPADIAVPQMGVHWSDVRSPELQNLLNNPSEYQQFTRTFIYGSWDGRFTFYEPMVTRAYLLSHPDVTMSIPVPERYPTAGYYPQAYRVTYDAHAKEYRIALTDLVLVQHP
ncbi:MAG TPA: hypothetical protein VFG50_04510 [Rhodothermales bacterium]|nr:hypothetical protein [Rhodothermales bacterium]